MDNCLILCGFNGEFIFMMNLLQSLSSRRWNKAADWECNTAELDWKEIVEPIMRSYTEATDGSSIEPKESGLVWHHQDADPDFGSWQAMELMDHLENVLANEPAAVTRGHNIVEVKPQVHVLSFFFRSISSLFSTPLINFFRVEAGC